MRTCVMSAHVIRLKYLFKFEFIFDCHLHLKYNVLVIKLNSHMFSMEIKYITATRIIHFSANVIKLKFNI